MPTGIYKRNPFSEKHRNNISKALKGRISPMKGKHHTEEAKQKISKANKGKQLSQETKNKISKATKSKNNPFYGKHHTKDIREKISKIHKGKHLTDEHKRKIGEGNKGKHLTERTKRKLSEAKKGEKNYWFGKHFSKEHIRKILTRRTPSSLEQKFQEIIDKYNLPYKYVGNGKFFIERYNPDFVNTNNEKIAIEVYASFYKKRGFSNIKQWKKKRTETFKKYGWEVIYFNETQVNEYYILKSLTKSTQGGTKSLGA